MNYLKIYTALIESRKISRDIIKEKNYEIHHILPKCMGGTNDKNNLVKLTIREHYVAHWLLIKIYPTEPKIYYAFLCMLRDPHENRRLTSRMVENIKRNFSEFQKCNFKINNPMFKSAAKEKISNNMKLNNPMTRFPEKNHTVKRTVVYYEDGTVKEFDMKKQFMDTLHGLTHMQKRYKIEKNDLKSFGIIKIERFNTNKK